MATAISLLASSVHLVLLLVTSFVGLANVTEASGCPVVTHSSACPRPSESELAWNAPAELLAMEAELKQSPDLELQLGRDYFTMILDHSQVTLRITAEGNVDWKDGIPTIYSKVPNPVESAYLRSSFTEPHLMLRFGVVACRYSSRTCAPGGCRADVHCGGGC